MKKTVFSLVLLSFCFSANAVVISDGFNAPQDSHSVVKPRGIKR